MSHVIETATSGRAGCRGCGRKIDKGERRFGERRPNVFGDGEMTLWFHITCAAYKRPEAFLEALTEYADPAGSLRPLAESSIAHHRLPRLNGASRAPTGRARCRSCGELIGKGTWRIGLAYFEELRFEPSGFIHGTCASEYFGTTDLMDPIRHFSEQLDGNDILELQNLLKADSS